ncbi:MAG: Hsp20/alpha crystallin family protein, partial [Fuerstia sp.]|nr:Hsp20/alpha crystallin family protein [Fuerstiella sp.]
MTETPDRNPPLESTSMIPASENATSEPRLLFNPPIDIYETPDGLVLYADLPG